MNTAKVLTLASMVGMLFAPTVFGADVPDYMATEFLWVGKQAQPTRYRVYGEKQDSGLGELSPSYTGSEFLKTAQAEYRVIGESLDSGLGELSPSYTGSEFLKTAQAEYRVIGESLDSGLGSLPPSYTAAEFQKNQQLARR